MQFGIFTVGDIAPDPVTGRTQSEAERIRDIVRIARRADELGLDVSALAVLSIPTESVLEQVELLATEVVPVLRREMAARRAPGVPDAPTHATLVRARYGDAEPRRPRPNANRGDNLTGSSPYQDSDPAVPAVYPAA